MKLLLHYLSRYKHEIFLALLLTCIGQVFNFLNPYFLGHLLIDPFAEKAKYFRSNGMERQFYRGITLGIVLIFAGSTITWISHTFKDYIINRVIQKFGAALYSDVQRHTLSLPFKDFEDQRSGEILSVLQRARGDSENFMYKFVNVLFTAIIGVTVVTVIAIQLTIWLPVIYLIGAGLLFVFSNIATRKMGLIQQQILKESNALAGSATESIRNIEVTKSMGLTDQEIERLDTKVFSILRNELKKLKSLRKVNFFYGAFTNSLHQGVIFLLLIFLFYDKITIGQLLMMQVYYYYIFGTLQDLGNVFVAYQQAKASMDNLDELLAKPVENRQRNAGKMELLESLRLEEVVFQHESSIRPVLDKISFAVSRGETIAIVGPSGSGKTTLVKLLAGLYRPVKGSIYYNEVPGHKTDFDQLRNQIGLVTQDTQLFSGTIRENILFANRHASDDMIAEVLNHASCQGLLSRAGQGMDTLIGEGGLKVSGGERQRLAIARALIREASLLIFDEATSSLDSLTEEGIARTIRKITTQNKFITIMIAHRLSTIMFADRIYVLEAGKIVEAGDHLSLLKEKGLYSAMWRQQIGENKPDSILGISDETYAGTTHT